MKRILITSLVAISLVACKRTAPTIWDTVSIEREADGVTVNINYPFAFGGDSTVTAVMNKSIEEFYLTALPDDNGCTGCTLDSAVTRVINLKLNDPFIGHMQYDLTGSGSVTVLDTLTSIRLDRAFFTGGANYSYYTTYLNMSNKSGKIIPIDNILKDSVTLTTLSRREFMKKHNFSDTTSAQEACMFITPKDIPLPQTIGFDSAGMVLFYNYYEVGPRVFGATELSVSYHELDSLGILKR